MKTARALLALALASSPSALAAHTQNDSLGAAASATDYYLVTCSDDGNGVPASLIVQVLDLAPVAAPILSVQVRKGAALASSSDATDADAVASPFVFVNGGAGVYDVAVDKSASGADSYSLVFHCVTGLNGSGIHTGTEITVRQNQ